jgi:hypothetical protein
MWWTTLPPASVTLRVHEEGPLQQTGAGSALGPSRRQVLGQEPGDHHAVCRADGLHGVSVPRGNEGAEDRVICLRGRLASLSLAYRSSCES